MISEYDKIHNEHGECTVTHENPNELGLEDDVYLRLSIDSSDKRSTYFLIYNNNPFPAKIYIEDLSRRFFTCIGLFKPKYYLHDIYQNTFTKEQKILLNKLMSRKMFPESERSSSVWYCLMHTWMVTTGIPNFLIPKNPPDYTLLPDIHREY